MITQIQKGQTDWHVPVNDNFAEVDDRLAEVADKVNEDSGWINLTLQNGWKNAPLVAGGDRNVAYRKIGKVVYLKGSMSNDSPASAWTLKTFATIPAGYRPLGAFFNTSIRIGSGIGILQANHAGIPGNLVLENQTGGGSNEVSFLSVCWVADQ